MPLSWALALGSCCGRVMYCIDARHRRQVYQNLKIAFGEKWPPAQVRRVTCRFFVRLGRDFAEFLCLPKLSLNWIKERIELHNAPAIDELLKQGKGLILMTMHYGNWELSILKLRSMGYPSHAIFKVQERAAGFNQLMMDYRKKAHEICGGITLWERGAGIRKLLAALAANQAVGMVIDQGGKEGVLVDFFGRQASISPGGVRLALKTGSGLCVALIRRKAGLTHTIQLKPFDLVRVSDDKDENVRVNLQKAVKAFEEMIRESPQEYMWMQKIWKFDTARYALILDDGRTGHLRQSETVAACIEDHLRQNNRELKQRCVRVAYRDPLKKYVVLLAGFFHAVLPEGLRLRILEQCLTPESFQAVWGFKADVVISAGSYSAPIAFLISKEHRAKSVSVLRPSVLPWSWFDLVIVPRHDRPASDKKAASNCVVTKGAPNLINEHYLKEYSALLLKRYSHLKLRDRLKIGVLLGGDTKSYFLDEALAKKMIRQIQDAANQLDADILLTTSRRTSEKVENFLLRELNKDSRCQLLIIANRANAPEAMGGILGLSDILVVTGDSISMVSEAASSGKKTVVVPVERRTEDGEVHKHNRFVDQLNAEGYVLCSNAQTIRDAIFNLAKNKITTRVLNDTDVIRQAVRRIL